MIENEHICKKLVSHILFGALLLTWDIFCTMSFWVFLLSFEQVKYRLGRLSKIEDL